LGCSPIKMVRELGSERRETVRSLSTIWLRIRGSSLLVREDWGEYTSCLRAVLLHASLLATYKVLIADPV
jgi:hypothetical protein